MSGGRRALRAGSLVAALLLWQALTSLDVHLWLRFEQFPTAGEVAAELVRRARTGVYWTDLADSLRRIVTGFVLAAVLGVATGAAVARSRLVSDVVGPVLEVLRPIPAIALVPVAILLFPSNEQGIVFITCAAAFFPVLVSTRHAVAALSPVWEEAVLTMGGGRWRILLSVVLPGALPGIFGGLSVGIGVSWICVISAEMISGEYGVGYRTWQDYTVVDYPGVFVGMATIGALGWLTATGVERLGHRLTAWLPRPAAAPSRGPAPQGARRSRSAGVGAAGSGERAGVGGPLRGADSPPRPFPKPGAPPPDPRASNAGGAESGAADPSPAASPAGWISRGENPARAAIERTGRAAAGLGGRGGAPGNGGSGGPPGRSLGEGRGPAPQGTTTAGGRTQT
ncbi:NitT/TauT family transport system permease protein [Streptomyces sp. 3211.6]|nr:NitT/TauT family transport system permease protein [Streptomyces sp. 3211.6]